MSFSSSYSNEYIENENFANIVYNYNWSSTPLGPIESWDPAIKTATSLCLKSIFPMCLSIGPPHWIQLYNKAWEPILKSKPCVIGMTLKEAWPEAYDIIMPLYDGVCTTKKGFFRNDDYYELQRDGYTEEAYFSYTYSPVFKSDGTVWALIVIAQETTQKVLNSRRLKILGEFGNKMPEIVSLKSASHITAKVLSNNIDIPYALIYFIEHNKLKAGSKSLIARLTATTFDEDGNEKLQFPDFLPDTPEIIDLSKDANKNYDDKYVKLNRHTATYSFLKCDESWPINLVLKDGKHVKVLLKDGSQAVLLSANSFCGDQVLSAILICGVNRLCTLDDKYMEFLQLVTNQMDTCLLQGKTREEEKQRSKILADLNYQKVMFFQGISHELKTPLTLMLSPLEDVINICPQDAPITLYLQTIRRLGKGADDYLVKPFSSQELITRIRSNINLSHIRQKVIFQQCKQEEIKQLLLSISDKVTSKLCRDETFLYVAKELYNILPCERISIISNKQIASGNNRMVALYEDLENITAMNSDSFTVIDNDYKHKSEEFNNLQEFLKNNSEIDVIFDVYCEEIQKNASMLSVEVRLNHDLWGWIKAYRPSNSIWLVSEIELLQQISNHISLAITYANLLEENSKKAIQMKAAEAANNIKNQILANTSHELRTPLGAIVGVLSSFESATFTTDQKDMVNIMSFASDIVLIRINEILNAIKLEAPSIILVNKPFNLLELFENTIEKFGKRAGDKNIELILNCDIDELSRYVKSDPERLDQVLSHLLSNSFAFTKRGEIMITISMQSQEFINEYEDNQIYDQMLEKRNLLIELHDTGVGMDSEYLQHIWESFSQDNKSGLSFCKSLVEINGGKIEVESQLKKGSKFWFTWNVELLSTTSPLLDSKFDNINYIINQKRILIIHPIENVRKTMLKYLKKVEKVDAFDTFDKSISTAKKYKELYGISAYDIAFIGLYKNNEAEVMKAVLELRRLEINNNNLAIIFITFQSSEGNQQAKKFIRKVGGMASIIYTPITWDKLINQFLHIYQYNVKF
ncbi:protein-histidine kinase [Gigaspora margarita]|uniref:histidine kinase n=1 Tax=Gigaspora margarita TaxID=4874 RepID=A0A8H4EKM9_GIGMA|nr:protein-histidine kinase [Gigaspora margarita]